MKYDTIICWIKLNNSNPTKETKLHHAVTLFSLAIINDNLRKVLIYIICVLCCHAEVPTRRLWVPLQTCSP